MYSGHGCLCVCLSLAAIAHYCTDVTWGMVGDAIQLCIIGQICNWCMGLVAMTTYTYVSL